jgi:signal transduction histidine kinase
VFGNLLQNALVHATGPVEVQLRARADAGHVLFSVIDNGPGIREEFHDLIFRKFARVPQSGAGRGTGLGLAFCRLAVRAHGGRVWVESDGSRGSAFHVRLPGQSRDASGSAA